MTNEERQKLCETLRQMNRVGDQISPAIERAADEIERLAAALSQSTEPRIDLEKRIEKLQREADSMMNEPPAWFDDDKMRKIALELEEARSALAQSNAEPVAWQCRSKRLDPANYQIVRK